MTCPRPRRGLFPVLALVLALVAGSALPAAAVDVTFRVRMAQQVIFGAFDPGSDAVDIAGTFNGWGGTLTPLADADGDTVYEVVLGGFTPGESIEFKFRINGLWDGTEEFPGVGNNRIHEVQPTGNLVDVWYNDFAPGGGQPGPLRWWNDTVFYEIFVRSFQDSDGDGIGDLPGLTARLDYLNDGDPATTDDLGVTGIWLMPINDAPSYHGYDATDYRSINPDYGTLADFETFLAAAHARGIKVIVDYVMNHCSSQHPWFQASRQGDPAYRDWFRWENNDPGDTGPWGQQVWHQDSGDWFYGVFWSGMPDLNYETQAVQDEMFATATWWLDTVGVDGFRLDAVLYIDEDPGDLQTTPGTLQFWQDFGAHVRGAAPEALTVGEAWTNTGEVVQYVADDRLDLCFEFELSYAIHGAINGNWAGGLLGKAQQVYSAYPFLQWATFLTNHDQDRISNVLGFDAEANKVAAAAALLLPGVPFLYYGEEIGMTGSGAHENIRTPMQWDGGAGAGFTTGSPWYAINGDSPTRNVAAQDADPTSLLSSYRELVHLRNAAPALRRGTFAPVASNEGAVLAFVRQDGGQTLLCLANTGPGGVGGLTLGALQGSLGEGDHEVVDLLDAADVRTLTVDAAGEITGLNLGGFEVRVYEVVTASGVPDTDVPPAGQGANLHQNHPNPFNPQTRIGFRLDAPGRARLTVHDLAGREVRRLVDEDLPAGEQTATWDGRDARGGPVASGAYLYRLETADAAWTRRMTLLK